MSHFSPDPRIAKASQQLHEITDGPHSRLWTAQQDIAWLVQIAARELELAGESQAHLKEYDASAARHGFLKALGATLQQIRIDLGTVENLLYELRHPEISGGGAPVDAPSVGGVQ